MNARRPQSLEFALPTPGIQSYRSALLAAGVALLVLCSLNLLDPAGRLHFEYTYLACFGFCLSICLGAMFFVLLHHLVGAKWSTVLRRLAEALMMNLPLMLVLFIPILFWIRDLYPWAAPGAMDGKALHFKAAWLNIPAFIARAAIYFAVWIGLARWLYSRSLRQDATGDPEILVGLRRGSAPGMILFAVTLTFAAFDWYMSLTPQWYSTIFGVYFFACCLIAIYSVLILVALALGDERGLGAAVTIEHYHDLGKLLFGFNVFWAYIAFSQFLLIWMANIPEETVWYTMRWNHGWRAVSWFLLVGHFILPFLFLLPRSIKRTRPLLALGAAWLLAMNYVDIWWLTLPSHYADRMPLHWMDFFMPVGMAGIFFYCYLGLLGRGSLVAYRDPSFQDSLAFENM